MKRNSVVLVVDDEQRIRRILEAALRARGYAVVTAADGDEAVARLDGSVDLVLTDLKMPGRDGLAVLQHARAAGLDMPVIMMTAFGTVDSAVAAMKQGAYDYLTKPFNLDEVELLVDRALATRALTREHRYLRQGQEQQLNQMIGACAPMRALFDQIRRVAPSDASVLIRGATGSGKELVARAVHTLSGRSKRLFVAVNCAAIPHELLESELFGHTRGAFTGAAEEREGKFALADGGTLFLDEIGDMSRDLQAKILRVLEEQRVTKVGSSREVKVDVRVVSATNRDLERAIDEGGFRQDLYYRLNVIELRVPPLAARPEDIPLLATHFLQAAATRMGRTPLALTPDAIELLQRYEWPGNVRELRNVCERLTVLSEGEVVAPDVVAHLIDLPARGTALGRPEPPGTGTLADAVARLEVDMIRAALGNAGGNKARAARLLGLSERNLWYKLKKYAGQLDRSGGETA